MEGRYTVTGYEYAASTPSKGGKGMCIQILESSPIMKREDGYHCHPARKTDANLNANVTRELLKK